MGVLSNDKPTMKEKTENLLLIIKRNQYRSLVFSSNEQQLGLHSETSSLSIVNCPA